jgi:3-deoxy-7-phosphoheptulonate synthase
MLVVMQPNASSADIDRVCEEITRQGFKPLPLPGEVRTAIGLLGDDAKVDWSYIEGLPGVSSVLIVQKPFRQASREWKPVPTCPWWPAPARWRASSRFSQRRVR